MAQAREWRAENWAGQPTVAGRRGRAVTGGGAEEALAVGGVGAELRPLTFFLASLSAAHAAAASSTSSGVLIVDRRGIEVEELSPLEEKEKRRLCWEAERTIAESGLLPPSPLPTIPFSAAPFSAAAAAPPPPPPPPPTQNPMLTRSSSQSLSEHASFLAAGGAYPSVPENQGTTPPVSPAYSCLPSANTTTPWKRHQISRLG